MFLINLVGHFLLSGLKSDWYFCFCVLSLFFAGITLTICVVSLLFYRYRKDRDNKGLSKGNCYAMCGIQLLWWTGLPSYGEVFQGAGKLWCMGLFWWVQPDWPWGTEEQSYVWTPKQGNSNSENVMVKKIPHCNKKVLQCWTVAPCHCVVHEAGAECHSPANSNNPASKGSKSQKVWVWRGQPHLENDMQCVHHNEPWLCWPLWAAW